MIFEIMLLMKSRHFQVVLLVCLCLIGASSCERNDGARDTSSSGRGIVFTDKIESDENGSRTHATDLEQLNELTQGLMDIVATQAAAMCGGVEAKKLHFEYKIENGKTENKLRVECE